MTRLVVAEWLKLRTTWGVWVYLALLLGVTALGVAGTIAADEGGWSPEDTRTVFETPGLATLFVLLLGAVGFTNEFRHATIGQTFLITPRRERVLGVKLLFFGLIGVVFGLVAYALMLAMAVPWLGTKDVDVSLASTAVRDTFTGVVVACALLAAFGAAIGGAVRNQVAAVVGILVWFLLVEFLVGALLDVVGIGELAKYLPSRASGQITGGMDGDQEELSARAGALVTLGWTALAAAIASLSLRRDVP
jgi:hypothetical protein